MFSGRNSRPSAFRLPPGVALSQATSPGTALDEALCYPKGDSSSHHLPPFALLAQSTALFLGCTSTNTWGMLRMHLHLAEGLLSSSEQPCKWCEVKPNSLSNKL